MMNLILLDNYYTPDELTNQAGKWFEYYNNNRYHEAIDNVTPAYRTLNVTGMYKMYKKKIYIKKIR